jgi:hypothetical protein
MTDRLTKIGRCYGMEMAVEKIMVMIISRKTTSYFRSETAGKSGKFQLTGYHDNR